MSSTSETPERRRLAVIGAGSSGLICLKYALELLPDWDIHCYEQSSRVTGAWGNPYPGFVSTSTKYTTQFACHPIFDAKVMPDGGASRNEFFRGGEYGEYLTQFAEHYALRQHITLECRVENMIRAADGVGWNVTLHPSGEQPREEFFDAVVICTGLAANPKLVESDVKLLTAAELPNLDKIRDQCIVVVGGGESAVDFANRLAQSERNNRVYLSLKSGIRVSPRYHPIRGVPSDFLRNRLLLSIHPDMRNWIGQRFVEMRIRYQELFERIFPHRHTKPSSPIMDQGSVTLRKEWMYKLTKTAKDDLFNMFHNKSDDFLHAVGSGNLQIVGPPCDRSFRRFCRFDSDEEVSISPDLVVPAIGYHNRLEEISGGRVKLADFYLACCHTQWRDLYLVGYARPVIGNIPSMSEMQARLVCGLLAGEVSRPDNLSELHQMDLERRRRHFPKLNLDVLFPVEMFPYCDQLARWMNAFPTRRTLGSLRAWWRMQLAPATTIHYKYQDSQAREECESAPIYMPWSLVLLLLMLKPVDWAYRLVRR